jgi:hypothetical protein
VSASVATRLPLRSLLLSTVVVTVALVAVVRHDDGSASDASARSQPASAAPGAAGLVGSRPAVNGSSRPALPAADEAAVARLAATSGPVDGSGHDHTVAAHVFGPAPEVPLTPAEADELHTQIGAATAALADLDTTAKASAAGYVLSSTPAPGVGVHWVDWQLIARPFDPARPAMLLFSRQRGVDRLVGFSYWVQDDTEPVGFAGPNDHWHTHSGLCVVNGWVEREGVASPALCPGDWLDGGDLWMLHTWLVPDFPNRWGLFAQANPRLCPSRAADLASCTPDVG